MDRYWPNLHNKSRDQSKKFWCYQWTKHGIQQNLFSGLIDYLQATIDVREKISLLGILKGEGIRPNGSYLKESFINAIRKQDYGVPILKCSNYNDNILMEINFML